MGMSLSNRGTTKKRGTGQRKKEVESWSRKEGAWRWSTCGSQRDLFKTSPSSPFKAPQRLLHLE